MAFTSPSVLLLLGTQRGVFTLQSDEERRIWSLRRTVADPGWSYGYVTYDSGAGVLYAAGHSAWYGAAVWRSPDLGATWSLSSEGITFGDDGPAVRRIWNITPVVGALYAGVDPAGLFRSDDGGANWYEVGTPLRTLPQFATWQPGKGGLPIHSIVPHPDDPQQLWVALAGGGVLYTADGGQTWSPRNPVLPNGTEAMRCQKLVAVPGEPGHLAQQNHQGFFRSTDGGRSWRNVTAGLPTPFGFPAAVHGGAPPTLFAIPHHNQNGVRYIHGAAIAVWRSRDGGESWDRVSAGLPDQTAYASVLRDGMSTDSLGRPGVYFGTSSGSVYGSIDGGDTWFTIAGGLPEVLSVHTAVNKP